MNIGKALLRHYVRYLLAQESKRPRQAPPSSVDLEAAAALRSAWPQLPFNVRYRLAALAPDGAFSHGVRSYAAFLTKRTLSRL